MQRVRTNPETGRRTVIGPRDPIPPMTQTQKDREKRAADALVAYIRSLPDDIRRRYGPMTTTPNTSDYVVYKTGDVINNLDCQGAIVLDAHYGHKSDGIVLALWKKEFVTWHVNAQGHTFWGHYHHQDFESAVNDYRSRAMQHCPDV